MNPKLYDPKKNNSYSINFLDRNAIPFEYDGVLPCIAVHRTTKYEVENCERIAMTSKFDWDSYGKGGSLSKVEAHLNYIESVLD